MELILKTKPDSRFAKGKTKYLLKVFLKESEVIKHNLPPEWIDTEQELPISLLAKMAGKTDHVIRARINSEKKDRREGKPHRTNRQLAGLDPFIKRTSRKHVGSGLSKGAALSEKEDRVNRALLAW